MSEKESKIDYWTRQILKGLASIVILLVGATKICAAGTVDTVSNIYANPNGKIVATFGPNADFSGKVLIGDNFGATFELVEFTDLIGRGMHRMQPADSRGYVRIRSGGTNGVGWRTVFVKVE